MQAQLVPRLIIVLMCIVTYSKEATSQDEDLEERLAYLQLERDDLDRRKFSVLIEKYRMTEVPIPNQGNRLISERFLQRYVRDGKANLERIDAVKLNALSVEDVNKSLTESQLIGSVKGVHYRGKYPADQRFITLEVKAGTTAMQTLSGRKHPFAITSTSGVGNRIDGDRDSLFTLSPKNKDVFERKQLPDGRSNFLFYVSNSAAIALTFSKDETWCIEQLELLSDHSNLDNLKKSDPTMLKVYCTCRTQWKKQGKEQMWLPVKMQIEEDNVLKESWEIRFTEWKFGDDVDVSLLDEANFTEEKIKASIDFQQVKRIFDDMEK